MGAISGSSRMPARPGHCCRRPTSRWCPSPASSSPSPPNLAGSPPSRWLPAEPFIHALSTTLQAGGSGIAVPPAGDLLNCALWAVVGLYVALRHFRWEPRGGEHRGHATTEVGAQ